MATVTGDTLPPLLVERLGRGRARLESTAVPVCTIGADGHSHPAMLSYRELAVDDVRTMRAAIYGSSTTARNLRERGRVTLLFVDEQITCYVKAHMNATETPHPSAPGVSVFPLTVDSVLIDAVDTAREPEAAITSGIRFVRASAGTTL